MLVVHNAIYTLFGLKVKFIETEDKSLHRCKECVFDKHYTICKHVDCSQGVFINVEQSSTAKRH